PLLDVRPFRKDRQDRGGPRLRLLHHAARAALVVLVVLPGLRSPSSLASASSAHAGPAHTGPAHPAAHAAAPAHATHGGPAATRGVLTAGPRLRTKRNVGLDHIGETPDHGFHRDSRHIRGIIPRSAAARAAGSAAACAAGSAAARAPSHRATRATAQARAATAPTPPGRGRVRARRRLPGKPHGLLHLVLAGPPLALTR